MGISIKKSEENPDSISQKEIEMIKTSWDSINNKDDFGISIMVRIFQNHKEIKNKWIFATKLETEAEMISNSQLRYHAKKILDVFSKIVNKLISTSSNEITNEDYDLNKLGRSHYYYGVRREHFFVCIFFFLIFILTIIFET